MFQHNGFMSFLDVDMSQHNGLMIFLDMVMSQYFNEFITFLIWYVLA